MILLQFGLYVLAACGAIAITVVTVGGIVLLLRGRRAREPQPWAPPVASPAARRVTYTWSPEFDPNRHADDGATQVIPHSHIPTDQ
jgi:hypothetical protein